MFAGLEDPVDEILASVSAGCFGNDGYCEVAFVAGAWSSLAICPTDCSFPPNGAIVALPVGCISAHEVNVCAAVSRTARHILTVTRLTVTINERYSFQFTFTWPAASIKRPRATPSTSGSW